MRLAAKYELPVVSFIDTPGAYPGMEAEAHGQSEAIARNLTEMSRLPVPVVVVVTGEGGSGGALGIGVGDVVLMMQHAIYSVISPEGCASILWRSADQAAQAAEALKLTAQDMLALKLIDEIVPEPLGGAHRGRATTITGVGDALERHLRELMRLSGPELRHRRREKFLKMGQPAEG